MKKHNNSDSSQFKQCNTCGLTKLVSEFRKNRNSCRLCVMAKRKIKYSGDRICTRCKIFKLNSEFYGDGEAECKSCKSEYNFNKLRIIKSDEKEYALWLEKHNASSRNTYSKFKDAINSNTEDSYNIFLWNTYKNARKGAKKRGRGTKHHSLEFTINFDHILKLFYEQNKKCAVTGIVFDLEIYTLSNGQTKRVWAPSIDRINSNGGYTPENVRLVCVMVNIAINNFGDALFKQMCESFVANQKISK